MELLLFQCNEKKISRHHAELLLKDDNTLWITPTHANPVFYRPSNGKTIQLAKDIERELKDGDHIALLPSSFFFRVSFSIDVNNNNENNDSDSDSVFTWKKEEKLSPVSEPSSDRWSFTHGHRRSTSNQDASVFDFDDDIIVEPMPAPGRRMSFEKKAIIDVESIPSPSRRMSFDKKITTDAEPSQAACGRMSFEKKTNTDVELTEAPCEHTSFEKNTITDAEPIEAPFKHTSFEKNTITDAEPTEAPFKHMSFEKKTITDVESTEAACKSTSLEKKMTTDLESQPSISTSVPTISLRRIFLPSSSEDEQVCFFTKKTFFLDTFNFQDDEPESDNTNEKERKLPKWMTKTSSSPVIKPATTTPKASYSRNSSYTASTSAKRNRKLLFYLTRTLRKILFLYSECRR